MGIEIERKFLVKDDSFKKDASEKHLYQQGYIEGPFMATVRVRIIEDTGYITIKSKSVNFTRYEYEYEIPLTDAQEMLTNLCGNKMEKYRHIVWFEGKRWEVDEFIGENKGLFVAELELKSEEEAFALPNWLGEEVTHDFRYRNSFISQNPFNTWE
ncbi:adenylate cyclase [Balneicella halophila]|uniref:Adenylate cyclase n=1 Tax=Balneicella halophila TaxID=1537566 RepID=A0A7L4USF3_BALHA|nr:CYTH domain-containing protein [Balneicella halophila]PVX51904.1 adenylate cyclase [Balneicella halophila]